MKSIKHISRHEEWGCILFLNAINMRDRIRKIKALSATLKSTSVYKSACTKNISLAAKQHITLAGSFCSGVLIFYYVELNADYKYISGFRRKRLIF